MRPSGYARSREATWTTQDDRAHGQHARHLVHRRRCAWQLVRRGCAHGAPLVMCGGELVARTSRGVPLVLGVDVEVDEGRSR
jgi:hypothetical protein